MLEMEDLLFELNHEEINEQGLPPGFRFHPTDEELITFYLASKVFNGTFCGIPIAEVDLNRCEPWELPDVAKMGEREWYFFSLRDRKYPTGLRTNRATGAGYWKATGKDREVYSASTGALLGMKKTLVFYKGRAPRGVKTNWVMHEYRLDGDFSYRHTCKEEWVMCRIVRKTGEKKINPVFECQSYLFEASTSSTMGSLPSLLESHHHHHHHQCDHDQNPMQMQALQNPFLMDHHQFQDSTDLKNLINPIVSQAHSFPLLNGLNSSFSTTLASDTITTPNNNNNKDSNTNHPSLSNSILFKSLLSHQGYTNASTTSVPKQCKTEANFSLFQQLPDANMRWVEKAEHHEPCYANPLFFLGMDYGGGGGGVIGFSSSSSAATGTTIPTEMSTSMAFSRTSIQTFLDPPHHPTPNYRSITGESWPLDL